MASIDGSSNRRFKLKVNRPRARSRRRAAQVPGLQLHGRQQPRRRIAPQALARFRSRVAGADTADAGRSLARIVRELSRYLFGLARLLRLLRNPSVLRDLDGWIRRRLRCLAWKQWKTRADPLRGAAPTRRRPRTGGADRRQPARPLAAQQQPAPDHALPTPSSARWASFLAPATAA